MMRMGRISRDIWAIFALAQAGAIAGTMSWDRQVIDGSMAGDIKAAGDIDADGYADLVVGGMSGAEPMTWYRYTGSGVWTKTIIAQSVMEWTTHGNIGDVDGDGDLDIIAPDGNTGINLKWLRNPLVGSGDPFVGSDWTVLAIGAIGDWGKDVYPADFDGDGRLDVATREHAAVMIFFQTAPLAWTQRQFSNIDIGLEGMGMADVDGDGDEDLLLRGVWLRNPGGSAARTPASWTEHRITQSTDGDFKAASADVDGDGRRDVIYSSSEGTAKVAWYGYSESGGPTGPWTERVIMPSVNRAHTLQAADMDRDGDTDVVVGQMHTATNPTIWVCRNDGAGLSWTPLVVDAGHGVHNGLVVDIGNDNTCDIFGANWTGNLGVNVWWNSLSCAEPASDYDGDCDVDGDDVAFLAECLQGPGQEPSPSCATGADTDGDGDADLQDFAELQRCFGGTNQPARCP